MLGLRALHLSPRALNLQYLLTGLRAYFFIQIQQPKCLHFESSAWVQGINLGSRADGSTCIQELTLYSWVKELNACAWNQVMNIFPLVQVYSACTEIKELTAFSWVKKLNAWACVSECNGCKSQSYKLLPGSRAICFLFGSRHLHLHFSSRAKCFHLDLKTSCFDLVSELNMLNLVLEFIVCF